MAEGGLVDTLIFGSGNLIPSQNNNQYQYNWPGGMKLKNAKVAIKNISIPYSWANIKSAYGNNIYQIKWPLTQLTGSTCSMSTFTVTMPDGFYQFVDSNQFNTYLQQYCLNNGLYLTGTGNTSSQGVTTTAGKIYYFISAQANVSYYSIEFDFFPLPLSADIAADTSKAYQRPSGWPTTTTGFTSNFAPQLVVPAVTTKYSFSTYIGFLPGTYPTNPYTATNAIIGVQSTFSPQVTPVQGIIVCLSIVSNRAGLSPNALSTIGISNTQFGSNLIYAPGYAWFSKALDGNFNNCILSFYDQNYEPLPIYDTAINVELGLYLPST
ncbi:MAG: hypothetical protein ACR2IJ_06125 [Fluviibacter sp.]